MVNCAPVEFTLPITEFVERFTSIEQAPVRSQRQEVRPFIGLLMDIIESVQSSVRSDLKNGQLKTSLTVT